MRGLMSRRPVPRPRSGRESAGGPSVRRRLRRACACESQARWKSPSCSWIRSTNLEDSRRSRLHTQRIRSCHGGPRCLPRRVHATLLQARIQTHSVPGPVAWGRKDHRARVCPACRLQALRRGAPVLPARTALRVCRKRLPHTARNPPGPPASLPAHGHAATTPRSEGCLASKIA